MSLFSRIDPTQKYIFSGYRFRKVKKKEFANTPRHRSLWTRLPAPVPFLLAYRNGLPKDIDFGVYMGVHRRKTIDGTVYFAGYKVDPFDPNGTTEIPKLIELPCQWLVPLEYAVLAVFNGDQDQSGIVFVNKDGQRSKVHSFDEIRINRNPGIRRAMDIFRQDYPDQSAVLTTQTSGTANFGFIPGSDLPLQSDTSGSIPTAKTDDSVFPLYQTDKDKTDITPTATVEPSIASEFRTFY